MEYKEIKGDLLFSPPEYFIVHCISRDCALGAGVAKQIQDKHKIKHRLKHVVNEDSKCVLVDKVFNLVTKEKYWHKSTYESLYSTLLELKNQMSVLGINKIAMPMIGCGLDRLKWNTVSRMIHEVFSDTPSIEIIVYYL